MLRSRRDSKKAAEQGSRACCNDRDCRIKAEDVDSVMRGRNYSQAEANIAKLLRQIGMRAILGEHLTYENAKELEIKELVNHCRFRPHVWWRGRGQAKEADVQCAITVLRRFMFLQMLMHQSEVWKSSLPEKPLAPSPQARQKLPSNPRPISRLQFAEAIYTLISALMRFVQDHEFLQIENAYVRTHLGVVLAESGRFHEAHRKLNEASGYLSQCRRSNDGLVWAVIDLRRAEVYLRQALVIIGNSGEISAQREQISENPESREVFKLRRRALAFLDDMRFAVNRAEHRFVGQRRDVWWWSLMYELKMIQFVGRVAVFERFPTTSPGSQSSALAPGEWQEVASIAEEAFRLSQSDPVRLARLRCAVSALAGLPNVEDPRLYQVDHDLKGKLAAHEALRTIEGDLNTYVQRVRAREQFFPADIASWF